MKTIEYKVQYDRHGWFAVLCQTNRGKIHACGKSRAEAFDNAKQQWEIRG